MTQYMIIIPELRRLLRRSGQRIHWNLIRYQRARPAFTLRSGVAQGNQGKSDEQHQSVPHCIRLQSVVYQQDMKLQTPGFDAARRLFRESTMAQPPAPYWNLRTLWQARPRRPARSLSLLPGI